MIVIDGSQGEGGGQIFRSSLTLAMCLGKSLRVENIRAGRKKTGLLRQHLTCLRAAQSICGAKVQGDELGSTEVEFQPAKVEAGEYQFSVGSAGSTSLVFQTVAMPLFFADSSSEITLVGGTHNGFAPSYDFIQLGFLRLLAAMGYQAETELSRFGFYPAGGGEWKVRIKPVEKITPLNLMERGREKQRLALATSARIAGHIVERELAQVQEKCFWSETELQQRLVESVGPGNILSLRLVSENVTELFEVVGEKQLRAEQVASRAINAMQKYLNAKVPVGEYLADQLLLPMVLAKGGQFITLAPSQHLLTNIEVIKQIMGVEVSVKQLTEDAWRVVVEV